MNELNSPSIYEEWAAWRNRYNASSSRETAYQIIRDKIIFLDYKPGEPLSDKLLAEELNMSRTPVREALIILSTVNMVVLKPQAGTFVAPIDAEWLATEQFSRYTLEKDIVAKACLNVNDTIAEMYRDNLDTYEYYRSTLNAEDRVRRMMQLDNEFHRIAFTAAGYKNNFYHMLNYMQHIERLRVLSIIEQDQKHIDNDHREISSAILHGDQLSAQYWTDCHLNRFHESLDVIRSKYPEYFTIG